MSAKRMQLSTIGRLRIAMISAGVVLTVAGCQADRGPVAIDSDDPDLQVQAIQRDVEAHDLTDAPDLVRKLSDEDSMVRFYSIEALRRLTGNDFGYDFFADPDRRAPAVSRWNQWLASRK